MKKTLIKFIPFLVMASLLTTGCSQTGTTPPKLIPQHGTSSGNRSVAFAEAPVYTGSVKDVSKKAKVISIEVGKGADAKTILVKFDDKTQGVEHAVPGHASIINYEMRNGEPWATVVKPKLAKLPDGVTELKTADLKAKLDKGEKITLVDSRPVKRFAQSFVPGAINIPVDEFSKQVDELPKDKNELLVFYCGGVTCGMSTDSAGQAKKLGYKNVSVYLEGEPGWIKAGHPTYASNDFVAKDNIVLIDLRSAEKSAAKRIPRSVSVPFATLKGKTDSIPAKAPVVLYSDNKEETMAALKDLQEAGLKKVSLVEGNIDGWIKAGGETTSGPVVTAIEWKRIMEKGEVSLADFLNVANGKTTDAVILDVRTKDESGAGKYKNAIAIPLDEVAARMKELPKDKKIYVHCSTGARADMAAKELNKNGYNAFFLIGNVECQGENCTITD